MKLDNRGFSLVEIVVASLLVSVVAAGTMASFIAAARISQDINATTMTEGGGRARQVLESLRNSVGAGSPVFTGGDTGWVTIPTTGDISLPAGTSTSPLSINTQSSVNQYRMVPQDCDGDGLVDAACYTVSVRQCWDGSTNCN